tara:strand:- start:55240 stop:55473 length:234 start_codon:yes stop_codon:yes gene_type:complete
MEMNKEQYERLMKRFALELSEIGVTENMIKTTHDCLERTPNYASVNKQEVVKRFVYQHNGYLIEAKQTVEMTVKKCK